MYEAHVEDENAPKDTTNGLRDVATRAHRLGGSTSQIANSVVRTGVEWYVTGTYIATSSVPWKENAACVITARKPRNWSSDLFWGSSPAPAKGPGCFQY